MVELDQVVSGIITVDEKGIIESLTPGASRLFGFSQDEVFGRPVTMLLPNLGLGCLRSLDQNSEKSYETVGVLRGGARISIALRVNRTEISGVHFLIGVLHRPTQCKGVDVQSCDECELVIRTSRANFDFLATMSHEIRTPLNSVLGLLHLLGRSELDHKQHRYVATATEAGKTLLSIINNILDFSKLEANKLKLESMPFDISALLEESVNMVADLAESKGLELVCRFAPDLPVMVKGDPMRLRQVIINLLSNAIKFTEHGEIVVRAEYLDGMVQISVLDTGIGMTAEQQSVVFNTFEQANNSTARRYGGTGLGLAISSSLVNAMGGVLWVDSQPGEGSEFKFNLSLEMVGVERSGDYKKALLTGKHILIIDDNSASGQAMKEMLEERGAADAHYQNDATEAISLLHLAVEESRPYDIMLLDMRLPGTDAVKLAETVREDALLQKLALIPLYPRGMAGEASEGEIFITKPVRRQELCKVLMSLNEDEQGGEKEVFPCEEVGYWFGGRRLLLVEDDEVNREVLQEMLSASGFEVEIKANGLDALEAVKQNDYDIVMMDVRMPEMDGLQATRKIRELGGAYREIPIVAMTANALNSDKEKSLQAGMNAHVSKPVDPSEMFQTLTKWGGGKRIVRADLWGGDSNLNDLPDLPGINMVDAMYRINGDWDLLKTVLKSFARKHAGTAEKIEGYVHQEDLVSAACQAHNLKGTGGSIGAVGVFQEARTLEKACLEGNLEQVRNSLASLKNELQEVVDGIRDLDAWDI